MYKRFMIVAMVLVVSVATSPSVQAEGKVPAALNFKMKSLDGKKVALSKYAGNVVLMVNVASACGLTPQYEQLQALHEKYAERGLTVMAFPCNQFGQQEPGDATEIQEFCSDEYGVTFSIFEKVEVNGEGACALYKHLTALKTKPKGAGKVSWNFEKFLVNRNGDVVARFEPGTKPDAPEVLQQIEAALADQ